METDTWIDAVLYDMTRYVALNAGHIDAITGDELSGSAKRADQNFAAISAGPQPLEFPVDLAR
ncbi:hypothetical protein [Rhodobacter ferrooxidans]|uniref:Uncharacterized protein n=1 Tax=Rhodobacter ferrooxidans TaxID=371731 RepID=C8S3Z4_9RHOB|nr:hypothetical protein [Rhodobacter sp. SW2]EEW24256.1 hypothetical protein Rsw2DRAFT_2772 [Rhodobacter sp. SW2]